MNNFSINSMLVRGKDVIHFLILSKSFIPNYVDSSKSSQIVELTFNGLVGVPMKIEQQGYERSGESWQESHWGTKSDALNVKVMKGKNEAVIFFDTLDSPPVNWLKKVLIAFPELEVELHYRTEIAGGFYFNKRTELFHIPHVNKKQAVAG